MLHISKVYPGLIFGIAMVLQACAAIPTEATTLALTPSVTIELSRTPRPTDTPLLTGTPTPTPTRDALTRDDALVLLPSPEYATAYPIPADDGLANGLYQEGFAMAGGSSVVGPDGYVFSAVIFVIPQDPDDLFDYYNENEFEKCRVAFYRSRATETILIRSFAPPKYPEGAGYTGYPIVCSLVDWYRAWDWHFRAPDDLRVFDVLNLNGHWSDINQNGLPEFTVAYYYCWLTCNADPHPTPLHFYEIQEDHNIVDLSAALPGVIGTGIPMFSLDPPVFYVIDPVPRYPFSFVFFIRPWWLYGLEDGGFVDLSPDYHDLYVSRVDQMLEAANQADLWHPVYAFRLLLEYEKAGDRQGGVQRLVAFVETLLETEESLENRCWLESYRAQALHEYALGTRFSQPYLDEFTFSLSRNPYERLFEILDPEIYDLAACEALSEMWPEIPR